MLLAFGYTEERKTFCVGLPTGWTCTDPTFQRTWLHMSPSMGGMGTSLVTRPSDGFHAKVIVLPLMMLVVPFSCAIDEPLVASVFIILLPLVSGQVMLKLLSTSSGNPPAVAVMANSIGALNWNVTTDAFVSFGEAGLVQVAASVCTRFKGSLVVGVSTSVRELSTPAVMLPSNG